MQRIEIYVYIRYSPINPASSSASFLTINPIGEYLECAFTRDETAAPISKIVNAVEMYTHEKLILTRSSENEHLTQL